ncbi:MAG: HAMP domain-containing protein [Spirochaetaceae bacterium]|jgi:adenylate cyclase|nr:HAMP domain-containing protein [Spirochaetaceae bacterium]
MPEKKQKRKSSQDSKVRFSIGFKLVTIITILMLLSLGAITVLVSIMVSQDVRVTAEDNNFTVNQRSAAEAEANLSTIRSNALVLLETISAAGPDFSRQAAGFFFERNQDIAGLAVVTADGTLAPEMYFVNDRFFFSREIEPEIAQTYIAKRHEEPKLAAAGETLLLNGAPDFGVPVLVLFFPWQGETAGIIFFSPEKLADAFGTGTNMSYMINGEGDILVHAENELIMAGANTSNQPFIRTMWENPEQRVQTLYTDESEVRYFGAFTKLDTINAAVVTSIEYNVVFEGIAATTRRNGYLSAAVLFISVLLIWFFSKSISEPLRRLSEAAQKIESGTFEVELKSKSRDEIGLLTNSFRRMSTALSIFGRFTNREIAVRAMRGQIKPGGRPKNATIFFSDIRGFTEKCENFTKEFGDDASDRIVHWLNKYLHRMVDCVEKTGGVVDKFIGDAVMAHWGTAYSAGSPEEDAYNCVKAALMMRFALMEMNEERREDDPGNPPIHIGCGINSGIVTAGQIGSDARMEYTVIGDPVNLASRAEALNKPLGTDILITEDTWNLIGNLLITEEMPPVQVKGKENPIRMFAVVNCRTPEGKTQKDPVTLAQVRKMLGIDEVDVSKANINKEEKKYQIGK